MSDTYVTSLGDTWDKIALAVYGNERHAQYLMANNGDADLLATVIFYAGITLKTPELTRAAEASVNLPPWRSST